MLERKCGTTHDKELELELDRIETLLSWLRSLLLRRRVVMNDSCKIKLEKELGFSRV